MGKYQVHIYKSDLLALFTRLLELIPNNKSKIPNLHSIQLGHLPQLMPAGCPTSPTGHYSSLVYSKIFTLGNFWPASVVVASD